MRLSFQQIEGVFGRPFVEVGDLLSVNDVAYQVQKVDQDGAEFVEVSDDDEAGDDEEQE